jgi:hypothetical protein
MINLLSPVICTEASKPSFILDPPSCFLTSVTMRVLEKHWLKEHLAETYCYHSFEKLIFLFAHIKCRIEHYGSFFKPFFKALEARNL